MNSFGYFLLFTLGTIGLVVPLYFILKEGIKKTDFTNDNFMNFKIEKGGISLMFLLIEIFSFLGYVYLDSL